MVGSHLAGSALSGTSLHYEARVQISYDQSILEYNFIFLYISIVTSIDVFGYLFLGPVTPHIRCVCNGTWTHHNVFSVLDPELTFVDDYSYNLAESIQRKMQGAHQADYVVRQVSASLME